MSLDSADEYADLAKGDMENANSYQEMADFYLSRAHVWALLAVAAASKEG